MRALALPFPALALGALTLSACHGTAPTASTKPPAESSSSVAESATTPAAADGRFEDDVAGILASVPQSGAIVVLPVAAKKAPIVREKGMSAAHDAHRPGSTVKPLLASAAADAGTLLPGTKHTCSREHTGPDTTCFAEHGELTLERAIAVSCNSYFYDEAEALGFERLHDGLRAYGFGKPTRLVPGDAPGLVPDDAFRATQPEGLGPSWPWSKVVGIGHGPFEASVLQLAVAYKALAQRIAKERGGTAAQSAVYAEIERGLQAAVTSEEGTARGAAVPDLDVAGKTGTAEAHHFGQPDRGKQNGWFVGYAPRAAPELVVAVLLLGAENGGKDAALVAGRVFGTWQRTRPH